ncbi:ABC transporter ATP-binding protein [Microlunatus panaciterrae]|uniref:ABC-2 type transport system ATP-binding protein n=1 Tax=Microlunatus panaciterrae TaxID=400768 RepID=A0ABS2RJZ7_9ACTN|nr:ABC transporter ATP-binding protein [Microlunatus panaciterrae]MBM7799329.1 ABC-2 type transport system ATP-binding protein [Microlunatus panaciterrae]
MTAGSTGQNAHPFGGGRSAVADAGLRVTGLTKAYRGVAALEDVELEVRPGRMHGLVGPNGAGKSTLLAALLGLLDPDSGSMEFDGMALGALRSRVPGGIAGAVEEARFYPYLDAEANLEVLARLDDAGGMSPTDALGRVGLQSRASTKVAAFSMGMRARLGVAACLMRSPALLVLDEPTGGLDPGVAADLLALLRELADGDVSVLLSSHDLEAVAGACDDVTILVRGRVVMSTPTQALAGLAPPEVVLRTSDDDAALAVAVSLAGVEVRWQEDRLVVRGGQAALDELVLSLAAAGIAIRRLEPRETPLRALFDRLDRAPK